MRWRRDPEIELPINAINGNLIFARDRAAGVYRLDTRNLGLVSRAEKHGLHGDLSTWMMHVEADFSIYRVCREYPVGAYVDDTVNMIDERYADRAAWERMLAEQAAHMEPMRSFVPEVYSVVSLQAASRLPWTRHSRELRLLRDADENVLETMTSHNLGARRALTRELQWMMRRSAVRGVCEPDVDPYWEPPALSIDGGVWEPGRADVQSFMPRIVEHSRYVHVAGEDGESIQAMLVMGKLPRTKEFPGSAELLFAPLEALPFPVDAALHARWLPNKKMLSICDDSIKGAADEVHDASARFLDRRTKRRLQESSDVQDYFASEPFPPGLESFICLAVGAPPDRPDLLKERVDRLQRVYRPVRLYRPHALQADLFFEHFLRPDGAASREYRRDYRRLLIAEQVAAMMPIGVNDGGSRRGIYVGYTIPGARRPIKYSVLEASEENRAGAVLMNGTLGGGKTIAGQLIAKQAQRRGSIVVDVDPRPDHSFEALLGTDIVHSISLENSDDYVGRLDPLVVAPPLMREELAVSYYFDLLPQAVPTWQTKIIQAVRVVLLGPNPSSQRVLDYLLASDEQPARDAGEALKAWSEWGLCKLAFGDGSSAAVDLAKPCTTIKVAGLSLPIAGTPRAAYDQSEAISVGTFKLIVAYAMRLVSRDRSAHKVLILDEVHAFTETNDGKRFLSRILRMARSMNVTVLLLTQLVGDLEKLKDLIGVVFAFRQENADQARANLRMLGLDEGDQRLVDMLCSFKDGQCLMRGLDGRVVAMQVDPADPEFVRLADTNPTRLLERQEAGP